MYDMINGWFVLERFLKMQFVHIFFNDPPADECERRGHYAATFGRCTISVSGMSDRIIVHPLLRMFNVFVSCLSHKGWYI